MPNEMRPSHLRRPFDSLGRLRDDYDPSYPDPRAPDIRGLPWERDTFTMWSTSDFRALVLEFISEFFAVHVAWVRRWRVRELRCLPGRQSLDNTPRLIVTIERSDAREFEASDTFEYDEMIDETTVEQKLARMGALLYQQHIDNS